MNDKEYQKKSLEAIYNSASLAPVFRRNTKYSVGKFAESIPYISYNDVINNKFIVRARSVGEMNPFDSEERDVIIEYLTIDEVINDEWRLD